MTINSTANRVSYACNGLTTAFAFPYEFFAAADLVVIETTVATGAQTTKALVTDYTISGAQDASGVYESGGTVLANVAPAAGLVWTIYRDAAQTQSTAFVDNDSLPAASLNDALDKLTILDQRDRDLIERAIRLTDGDTDVSMLLPSAVARASQFLAFDGTGAPVASPGLASAAVSSAMAPVVSAASLAAARAALGTLPIVNVKDSTYGSKGDGIVVNSTAVSITSGLTALTVAGAAFTSADVGKTMLVPGAGASGACLFTTIAACVGPTQVTVANAAGSTLIANTQVVAYGTDDTAAIKSALTAVSNLVSPTNIQSTAQGGQVYLPRGIYITSSTLYLNSNVHLVGEDCGPINQGSFPASLSDGAGNAVILYASSNLQTIAIDTAGFWLTTQPALSGTASAGSLSTITIATGLTITEAVAITITAGTGAGQSRPIPTGGYVSGTGVVTPGWPWNTAPDNTSQWAIAAHNPGDRITQALSVGEASVEIDGVGTIAIGVAVRNLVVCSIAYVGNVAQAHNTGIRAAVAAQARFENLLIFGFDVGLEAAGCSYSIFENIVSNSLMTGFGWVIGDHLTRIACESFESSAATISATTRPWFVDWMSNEGIDPHPEYWTAHYVANTEAGVFISCDGEGGDRSYFLGSPTSEVFVGCHMERWNHVGFYMSNGGATWLGGDFFIASAAPAFSGGSPCNLTIDGVMPTAGTSGSAVVIGAFSSQFGGHVTVRNAAPGGGDSRPAITSCVSWDSWPPLPVQETDVSGNTPLTLTGAQIAGAPDVTVVLTATLAGAGAVTSPTAAQIFAAAPFAWQNNPLAAMTYKLRIVNNSSGAFAWTLGAGTNVTLTGTMTIAQHTWRDFIVTLTDATHATIKSIGTGTYS